MKRSTRFIAWSALLLTLGLADARADSVITLDFAISVSSTPGTTVFTSQFPAFNPALGTLLSLSADLSGTLNYSGKGDADDEGTDIEFQEDPVVARACQGGAPGDITDCVFFPTPSEELPFEFTLADVTDPEVLAEYTGTGVVDFGLDEFSGNETDMVSYNGSGRVSYDFIAGSVATPEPGGLALLFVGLVGLAVGQRHRSRSSKSTAGGGPEEL